HPLKPPLFPYTTLFRSLRRNIAQSVPIDYGLQVYRIGPDFKLKCRSRPFPWLDITGETSRGNSGPMRIIDIRERTVPIRSQIRKDRKSTRLNSSHVKIS